MRARNRWPWLVGFSLCALGAAPATTDQATPEPQLPQPAHRAILHIHTTMDGGRKSLATYVHQARALGLDAIFVTDHDYQRWEYGAWPARGLIKKRIELPSALQLGAQRYLQAVAEADALDPDVLVVDGMEAAPFYYWSGSYWNGTFTLNDRDKHLLVFGLDAAGYEQMPLIANGRSRFDQYHGNQYAAPYQDLIDYVTQREGLVFWAHPEAREVATLEGVRLSTLPYGEMLLATTRYTGFCIYPTGGHVGEPGGLWDRVLQEYCQGRRTHPVWAIGELDDHGDRPLTEVATVLWAPERSRAALLEALRRGRMYVTYGPPGHPILTWYAVRDGASDRMALSGEELRLTGGPVIECTIESHSPGSKLTVRIIKDGAIIHQEQAPSPIRVRYTDLHGPASGQTTYYRIYAQTSEGVHLATNPIFVTAP